MRRALLIILICALSAMTAVPKRRRAIDMEEEENKTSSSTSATTIICAPQTPCGWLVYDDSPTINIIKQNITNTYCKCAKGTKCIKSNDVESSSALVLKCKTPES